MSRLWFARSERKIANLTRFGMILASVVVFCGCSTLVTKEYEGRIRMSKAEAVRFLQQYLREEKDLSVDEKRLAFTYQRKVVDRTREEGLGLYGRGMIRTTTFYHKEEFIVDIEFATIVRIRKVHFAEAELLYIYDNKGVERSGGRFGRLHIDDKFVSALLALCPKVETSSSVADPSDEIYLAIDQGDTSKLLTFLEKDPELINFRTDYGTPLYIAAEKGNTDAAALLLGKGAKVDGITRKIGGEFTPLYIAAENGHKNVVELLLAHGAEVNAKTDRGFTPLHDAAYNDHGDVVELLVTKGAQVNAKSDAGVTPLYNAAQKNGMVAAKLLIAKGAEIDAPDNNGFLPLHIASMNGHRDFAELLIANGAKVNAKSNHGYASLYCAAEKDRRDVAILLINQKADVNLKTKNGRTPLHIAAWENHRDMMELLIVNGADMNAKNVDGSTPLHIAAARNYGDVVSLLIVRGADINAKDSDGRTPLHFATKGKYWDIANLLRRNGGLE